MARPQQYLHVSYALAITCCIAIAQAQRPGGIRNAIGLHLLVDDENTQPTLRIVLPRHPDNDRAIEVLFSEHVTARKRGSADSEQLYLFRPGKQGEPAQWRHTEQSLEYEKDFKDGIHMLARATLEEDGVRFHYEFVNRSSVPYEM